MGEDLVDVRGVMFPRSRVEQMQDEVGGKLVGNSQVNLLLTLDDAIRQYFLARGFYPPNKTVEPPSGSERYIYRNFEFLGIEAEGPLKIWFRCPKIYTAS